MKKKNSILVIICIIIVIVTAIIFIGNTSKNPLIGFWQEDNYESDVIRILEFNKNGYMTKIMLNESGRLETESSSYSYSKESKTVIISPEHYGGDTYRYNIENGKLMFWDTTWKRINDIDFLEKEQQKRIETEEKRLEEQQRIKEEQLRLEEEQNQRLNELRSEFKETYCETPLRSAEIKLIGKWIQDNTMFRSTYEFFEDGTVIRYASDSRSTYTGTYHVYPYELNPSDWTLLHFKDDDYEPSQYKVVFDYNEFEHSLSYYMMFIDDYIKFSDDNDLPLRGWKYDKVN